MVTSGASRAPLEVEVALAIASSSPGQTADAIAGLASLGGMVLVPAPPQQIRDVQVDTAGGALTAGRLSLRLRTIGDDERVALKGHSRGTSWGAVERLELDLPWSPQALREVVTALRDAGVAIRREPAVAPDRSAPMATADAGRSAPAALAAYGLRPVQIRSTERRLRHASAPDDGRLTAAEIAIDAVTYRLDRREVRLYEVEIEVPAGVSSGASVAAQLAHALMERFAPALRSWPHGKLATGLAAQELLAAGRLETLLLEDGSIGPGGFDAIDTWLGGGRR